jgi:hypothetical protein
MTASVGIHISLIGALLISLGSMHTGAQEPNPRIRREGTKITFRQDATNEDLARLKSEKGITSLASSGVISGAAGPFITDAGLAHIAGWTELRVLRLSELRVGDAGLAHLAGLTKLEIVDLYSTKVSDAGLAHLGRLTGLKELWLDGLPLSDVGAAHLRGLTKLKVLRFHNAAITDAGLESFKDMTGLEDLQLGHALITDKGMPVIARMKKLKTLDLRTKVTDAGLVHLDLKQAYVLRIFVPGGDFGPGRTVHGRPAWTAGWELFGVVHGHVSFLRLSP